LADLSRNRGTPEHVKLATLAVVVLLAVGCGGDDEVTPDSGAKGDDAAAGPDAAGCVDPSTADPIEGLLVGRDDFDTSDCDPGTLAGLDPSGLWFVQQDPHPRFSRGPVRFGLSCEQGIEVGLGGITAPVAADVAWLNDDELFWRRAQSFGMNFDFIDAYLICKRNADGTLSGRRGTCYVGDFGESCDEQPFTASPFGNLTGEAPADGFEIVSEFRGGADPWPAGYSADVRVRNGVAYVANGLDGLRIVDVSDPAAPAELGHVPAKSDNFNELKLADAPYILVASQASGVFVLDVTDPTDPQQVTRFSPNGDPDHGVHTLFVEPFGGKNYAYLADGGSDNVFVFDVTDPTAPIDVGTFNLGNEDWGVHALTVVGDRAYINATYGGLIVADLLPDPSAATILGQYQKPDLYAHQNWVTTNSQGRTVAVYGDEGFGSHLEIVDVDPVSTDFMKMIGELTLRDQVSIHDIMVFGDTVYVAHYQDGFRVFDISDAANPLMEAWFNTWDPDTAPGSTFEGASGLDVDLSSGLVYLTDTPRGLVILRPTD